MFDRDLKKYQNYLIKRKIFYRLLNINEKIKNEISFISLKIFNDNT